ncbi:YcfL family protein [Campylobacter sp.]|uniref:YcfL family protein n=1 Tax=Campylobacter sp. TaxID=205 RepID=UPI0026DBF550|nr:YcfL family protein [Campylobacter sp.]MDO4674561.1 YcfL family protein [Campylobacter sp.]
MKKVFLFLMVFFCACTPQQNNSGPRGEIATSKSAKNLIKQMKSRVNDNGFLELELTLRSALAKDVFYKVDWLDKDGFVLQNPIKEDYQPLRLPPQQEVILKKLAFDKRAVDFKIDIRMRP